MVIAIINTMAIATIVKVVAMLIWIIFQYQYLEMATRFPFNLKFTIIKQEEEHFRLVNSCC